MPHVINKISLHVQFYDTVEQPFNIYKSNQNFSFEDLDTIL